jgi:hypothetical protein
MSLLEDAGRLYLSDPINDDLSCFFCGQAIKNTLTAPGVPHAPDCPWLSMPKIVAALEAAESLLSETGPTAFAIPPRVLCRVCYSEGSDWTHTARCPWAALREALDA